MRQVASGKSIEVSPTCKHRFGLSQQPARRRSINKLYL